MSSVRIWDLPTRLFHWSLVICVSGLLLTSQIGGLAMWWHFRLGYAVLALLMFRLLWGVLGGFWSRWAQLPLSPRHVMRHLRGQQQPEVLAGHNPLGAWSVLAMLLWLLFQVFSGMLSDDEISNAGPWTSSASGAVVSAATAWHKGIGKLGLIGLLSLHVAAISYYHLIKHDALVAAMLHGNKLLTRAVRASQDNALSRCLAVACLIASVMAMVAMVYWGST